VPTAVFKPQIALEGQDMIAQGAALGNVFQRMIVALKERDTGLMSPIQGLRDIGDIYPGLRFALARVAAASLAGSPRRPGSNRRKTVGEHPVFLLRNYFGPREPLFDRRVAVRQKHPD
jgi:hypothetical protein